MNEKKEFDSDIDFATLGHYVEGDYMAEETNEESSTTYISPITYISPESGTGHKLQVIDHTIMIIGPHGSQRSFTFDNQEDWENFCEASWKTENYIPMKRTDFVEFFEALRFTHHYHSRNLELAKRKLIEAQKEVSEQERNLDKLYNIMSGYEEVYNESKV